MNIDLNQTDRLLRISTVLELTAMGRTQAYDEIKMGRFPKPVKLGRASAWPESEIRAWIEARKAERTAA